jgi:hypothetical protein
LDGAQRAKDLGRGARTARDGTMDGSRTPGGVGGFTREDKVPSIGRASSRGALVPPTP